MSKKIRAWWFEPADGKLGYGDGRRPRKGITHKVDCQPEICESGLHASVNLIDALSYAVSPILWRVEIGGEIATGDDKISGQSRKYLKKYDVEKALRKFARMCALDVVDLWDAPDVVVRYLKTGDESIRAAARAAAWAAAWAAAGDAAWDAARAAAWDAAGDAAWDAARDAARAAAWDAAWDAAREKQNRRLIRTIRSTS